MSTADEVRGGGAGGRSTGRTPGGAGKAPRAKQDLALKLMFAISVFVVDFLLTFLAEKAIKLDLTTLRRLPTELIGPELRQMFADTVWIAELIGEDGLFAYVHFEFQERNDPTMPERMMRYEVRLRWAPLPWSAGGTGGSAPVGGVLSVVLYTGRTPWTASRHVERERGGEPWPSQRPPERYELVDLSRSPCDDLDGTSVWAVVQKIHCAKSPEEVLPLWRELMRRAAAKGGEEGCLAAGAFVEELLRPLGLAEKIRAANRTAAKGDGEMPERAMSWVDERWAQWTRNLLERGERRGRAQGVKEARAEQAAMLLRFAARKFGQEAVERLAVVATAGTGPASLALLGDWIIDCDTAEELLARVDSGAAE